MEQQLSPLSPRNYFAGLAMQTLLWQAANGKMDFKDIVKKSFEMADEMEKETDEKKFGGRVC